MSYNGSGTFVINTAGQPVVSGTVISSTAFNALTADLATGLSTAITKDGQTTPTANIPMGNNKITNLAVGTAATDAANLSQVQSTTAKLVNSISGADTITGTMSPNLAAYATGQMFYFIAAGDNTGAVTLNIDALGAKSVTRDGSVALAAGDIKSGEVVVVVYDGTRFQVVSQINSSGNATFANVSITSALNVGGVATVTGGATLNGGVVINELGADADTRIEGDTDANLVFVDASTDRVGIGTTSPAAKLEVTSTARLGSFDINVSTANSAVWIDGSDFGLGTYYNNALKFLTNNGEKARITAGGNFGVNTTNPQQKIHITGNDQTNVRMRWENNGTGGRNYEIVGGLNAANNSSFSVYDATAAANRLEITSTGTFIVPQVYNDTTANAANMQVDSAGVFRRSTSSLKYKTDVQDATHGLAEVLALRPVTYKGKTDGDKVFGGLIAEEVHDAGLTEFVVYDNEGNPDALAYGNMVSVLVKAIQELSAKVAALEAK